MENEQAAVTEQTEQISQEMAEKVDITNDDDDVVDPWNVSSKSDKGVDYDKLISK